MFQKFKEEFAHIEFFYYDNGELICNSGRPMHPMEVEGLRFHKAFSMEMAQELHKIAFGFYEGEHDFGWWYE